MKKMQKQQGFLIIAAVVLIVIFGFIAGTIAHMYISSSLATVDQQQSSQALYIAGTGLEEAKYVLTSTTPADYSQRLSCAAINGHASFTNASLGAGVYTVTATRYAPTPTTLSSAIGAADTTIPVASTTGYANFGRIWIGLEVISYTGITANSFTGATRGVDGTTAASHSSGDAVIQNQCSLRSQGGVPNLTSPNGKRQVETLDIQFQPIWAVGDGGTFTDWNLPTVNTWASSTAGSSALNDLSMLNQTYGWAVGASGTIRSWSYSGLTWNAATSPVPRALNSVSSVSTQQAWAVGDGKSTGPPPQRRYTILRYDGSSWCELGAGSGSCSSITIPSGSDDLFGVSVVDTSGDGLGNLGFAVGSQSSGGLVIYYDGTNWTNTAAETNLPSQVGTLHEVQVMSANEAWAVGDTKTGNAGKILRWTPTGSPTHWQLSADTDRGMNAISMIDTNGDGLADYGWAVGNAGRAYVYSGGSWTRSDIGINATFNGVAVYDSSDVWAVGASGSNAQIVHWDGSAWTLISSGGSPLNAIDVIPPKIPALTTIDWQEIYN